MFSSLSIQNFRGLRDLNIEGLKTINVFVGENAVGKTSVLDALFIMINPNNPVLPTTTNTFRHIDYVNNNYWESLFFKHNTSNEIVITGKHNDKTRETKVKPINASHEQVISKENNTDATSKLTSLINGLEIHFSIDGKTYEPSEIKSTDVNKNQFVFKTNNSYTEHIQGHYLAPFFATLNDSMSEKFDKVNDKYGKEHIISFLKMFEESIEDIELNSNKRLVVRDRRFDKRVSINTYGTGLSGAMHIYLTILSEENGVTLIDEIENGLHWTTQQKVWEHAIEAIKLKNQQLFLTTHSREMIKALCQTAKRNNYLDNIRLYRLEKKDGTISVVNFTTEQFEFALSGNVEIR